MNEFQKIIKYLAIAFAFFLVFSIISGIMCITVSFTNIFTDNDTITEKFEGLDINGDVKILDVEIKNVNIAIKEGDILKAETNSDKIKINQEKDKLYITQSKSSWFNSDNDDIIIYIPTYFVFDGVAISNSSGKVEIENLSTNRLYLELGAGKVDINKLTVLEDTKIDGGAGAITIKNGSINNLDLDMGVGKLSLTAAILGDSEIDAGIGGTEINLVGSKDDYKIKIDKGVGSATIEGKSVKEDVFYGSGTNIIDIDGGIGSIKINFVS